jgi:hypothetical protein
MYFTFFSWCFLWFLTSRERKRRPKWRILKGKGRNRKDGRKIESIRLKNAIMGKTVDDRVRRSMYCLSTALLRKRKGYVRTPPLVVLFLYHVEWAAPLAA